MADEDTCTQHIHQEESQSVNNPTMLENMYLQNVCHKYCLNLTLLVTRLIIKSKIFQLFVEFSLILFFIFLIFLIVFFPMLLLHVAIDVVY